MAKQRDNNKKPEFYTDPSTFGGTDTHTHTHTDTDTYEYTPEPETRSKRANLLVRPSVWDALTKIAKRTHRSNNDIINELIEKYIEER